MQLGHFERPHSRLSDSVIGHVLPRGRPRHTTGDAGLRTPLETALRTVPAFQDSARRPGRLTSTSRGGAATRPLSDATQVALCYADKTMRAPVDNTRLSDLKRLRDVEEMDKFEKLEIKKAIRREQCRNNQARYRDRQRALQRRMQHEVQQLHEEVQGLKLKRQRLRFKEKTNRSAWSIVSDVFRLLETGFCSPWYMTNTDEMMKHTETRQILTELQKAFEHDVGMGGLQGVEALVEQLRRYSLYFSDPQMYLQRVEELVPGVVTATARFKLMVSEFTLRCVFPHLEKPKNGGEDEEDIYRSLRKKLLGKQLDCRCKVVFLMNEESGRVARLEVCIDVVGSLLQLLRDTIDASNVLDNALLTQDCVVGDLTDHPQFENLAAQ
ncbi:hypothetical protein F443_03279 [Phytophthora nicotianae P1569]|uniref:Bzip transcription factor n=1 Tax=Phytophthora nicotianae P1569 TaxID=1317065 RepID=V9FTT7_PHYNI|nr:hypothetical protein F443_03279 [Phytophthora nicotianae P1569]